MPGINLEKNPVLQYLYYLTNMGVSVYINARWSDRLPRGNMWDVHMEGTYLNACGSFLNSQKSAHCTQLSFLFCSALLIAPLRRVDIWTHIYALLASLTTYAPCNIYMWLI